MQGVVTFELERIGSGSNYFAINTDGSVYATQSLVNDISQYTVSTELSH